MVDNVNFAVAPGEGVVLGGPSGAGTSSCLKRVGGAYASGAEHRVAAKAIAGRPVSRRAAFAIAALWLAAAALLVWVVLAAIWRG